MSFRQGILLTGSTGLLGRYLLRDLLATGRSVAVLIRRSTTEEATERLARLLAFAEESLGRKLPRPTLLIGDLNASGLGLETRELNWLARNIQTALHAAAYVSYHPTPSGEPWETNVNGTRRLLEMCRSSGITEMHYLSTAFVCGDRCGLVREDELDCGGGSDNAYEQSKFAAEKLVRGFAGIRATIHRPSVIVGDSRTGYTCTYHHFYRFLELAVRLAGRSDCTTRASKPRRHRQSLRLPLTGNERQNLVPVDWVSRAVLELMQRSQWHGRTYHLAAYQAVTLQAIKATIEDLLLIEGVQWAGRGELVDPTALEQMIVDQFRDYWSYLESDIVFDCRNTRRALPDLPPPPFDRGMVERLLRYAQADNWGRGRHRLVPSSLDLAQYLEHELLEQVRQSPVRYALPRGLRFSLDLRGPGGGTWSFKWVDGGLSVHRGLEDDATVTYRLEASIFADLLRGRQTSQKAFFEGNIAIEGDEEKALQLALIIEQFLVEFSARPTPEMEAVHAGAQW